MYHKYLHTKDSIWRKIYLFPILYREYDQSGTASPTAHPVNPGISLCTSHFNYATLPPHPHNQGIAGTILFFQQSHSRSPALRGQTDGEIPAICPRTRDSEHAIPVIPAIFWHEDITPALWGQCKSKPPILFPHCGLGGWGAVHGVIQMTGALYKYMFRR